MCVTVASIMSIGHYLALLFLLKIYKMNINRNLTHPNTFFIYVNFLVEIIKIISLMIFNMINLTHLTVKGSPDLYGIP